MEVTAFVEIAVILGMATVLGIIGQKLRQPLIIMFLAAGILAGPSGMGIIQSHDQIELLAQIGIALLLFIVGLKLDLHLIRTTGLVALVTGLGQIVFTSLVGFLIAIAMDMTFLTAVYVSVALTFSSTIIIVKLLSDKKEIDSLHGQIAIGFLIVQDIAAILALIGLTTLGSSVGGDVSIYTMTLLIAVKGVGLFVVVFLLMKYVIPYITMRLAHSLELLTLFAITWAIVLGAGSELLGFSKEVGAFLAGMSLASTDYRDTIGAKLTTLRDFLLVFFFIDLGTRLDWSTVSSQVGSSLIFSLFVLIGNPLIVLIIMGLMGYRRRTAFLAGLVVAQISEFSLIVAALGLHIGHITNETMGLITLVGVVTIFISTYMILYSGQLYNVFSRPLKIFERSNPYRETALDTFEKKYPVDVILVGLGDYGSGLAEYLIRRNKTVLGVDFDPDVLEKWRRKGISVLYGDMADPEIHEQLPLGRARWIISTVRSKEFNLALLHNVNSESCGCRIALTAINEEEADYFKNAGAHLVFRPFADAAEQAADSLSYAMDSLPDNINWPVSFIEERVKTDASIAGNTIRDISLRAMANISILAVSRAGEVNYDPHPDYMILPGDRLLIAGPPEGLRETEKVLNKLEMKRNIEKADDRFEIAEIEVGENSGLSEKSLADLRFRQVYGVTLIGIRRGDKQITTINPDVRIIAGDYLIIIGKYKSVRELKKQEPL